MTAVSTDEALKIISTVNSSLKKEKFQTYPTDYIVFKSTPETTFARNILSLVRCGPAISSEDDVLTLGFSNNLFFASIGAKKALSTYKKESIGFHSDEGALNYSILVNKISNSFYRSLFTSLLVSHKSDADMYHVDEATYEGMIVTKELIDSGITAIPQFNSYLYAIEKKQPVELTPIQVGDILLLTERNGIDMFYIVDESFLRLK